jgi:hypothetical protein
VEAVLWGLEIKKTSWTVPTWVRVTWEVVERERHPSAKRAVPGRALRDRGAGRPGLFELIPSLGLDLPPELLWADGEAVYQVDDTDRFAPRSALRRQGREPAPSWAYIWPVAGWPGQTVAISGIGLFSRSGLTMLKFAGNLAGDLPVVVDLLG